MPRRVMMVVALFVVACRGISFANDADVGGAYTLRTVNGQALPVALGDRTVALNVSSGVLTLTPDGDWSEQLTGTTSENGQTVARSITETGRWSMRAPYLELIRADGAVAYSGAFSSSFGPKLELQRIAFGRAVLYVYAR